MTALTADTLARLIAEVDPESYVNPIAAHILASPEFAAHDVEVAAQALRDAADAWDSDEERPHLTRLADEQYQPGGPSMPAIWLRDRAAAAGAGAGEGA